MGRCSATGKSDKFEEYDDPRTQRRLRRRCGRGYQYFKPKSPGNAPQKAVNKEFAAANQHFEPKSPCNGPQRTVNVKKQVNEIVMEPHYKEFLDCTAVLSDSGDHSVDFKYTGAESADHVVDSDYDVILQEINEVCDDKEDPDYKLFLENLREDGKSYVLQVFVGNEMSELIKYEEEEDWLRDGLKLDTPKTLEGCPANEKTKDKETQKGISIREMKSIGSNFDNISSREDPNRPRASRYEMRFKKMETLETSNDVPGKRRKNSIVKRNANVKQSGHVSGRKKGSSNIRPGSETTHLAKNGKNHEAKFDADESYALYLDDLERDGEEVISVCQSDSPLRTDKDGKTESDLEMTDKDPFGHERYTPFVTSKYYHDPIEVDSCDERLETGHSPFRERLIEILKRPYNSIEYEERLQEISCRRPIERDRNLRSVTKSYKLDYISQSYLDWCTEFAEKVHLARDNRLKTLNLLRGFFYWLQNVSVEGVFRPWLDPECLEVLPQVDNSSSESDE